VTIQYSTAYNLVYKSLRYRPKCLVIVCRRARGPRPSSPISRDYTRSIYLSELRGSGKQTSRKQTTGWLDNADPQAAKVPVRFLSFGSQWDALAFLYRDKDMRMIHIGYKLIMSTTTGRALPHRPRVRSPGITPESLDDLVDNGMM
jgi:hypothetical protein